MTKQDLMPIINQLESRPFAYTLHSDTVDHWFELDVNVMASPDLRVLLNLIDAHGLLTSVEGGKLVIR